jgi:hypothetical protein
MYSRPLVRIKTLWIVLPIVGMFLFVLVGGVLGIVYLTAIRPKLKPGA